ncbi:MAG: thiamine phosphate synthase [Eubacteriales bacterium]|jgi:thiamine-phosphate pyrophosphorylase
MKFDKNSMLLYAVTDRTWLGKRKLIEQVGDCLKGGATFIQLREKKLSYEAFLAEAREIKTLCRKYRVPFVINDNVDIAVACDADGVHIGQSDMKIDDVRARFGGNKIIGVSAITVKQAIVAEQNGADYLGVGAVFSTSTKLDADTVSHKILKAICDEVSIPVVAIGGISSHNILELKGTNIDGVAVISAIFAQPDIKAATEELLMLSKEMVSV